MVLVLVLVPWWARLGPGPSENGSHPGGSWGLRSPNAAGLVVDVPWHVIEKWLSFLNWPTGLLLAICGGP